MDNDKRWYFPDLTTLTSWLRIGHGGAPGHNDMSSLTFPVEIIFITFEFCNFTKLILLHNHKKMVNPDQLHSEKKMLCIRNHHHFNAVCHSLKIGIIFGIISHRKGYIISRNGLCWISCHTTKRPIENKKSQAEPTKLNLHWIFHFTFIVIFI